MRVLMSPFKTIVATSSALRIGDPAAVDELRSRARARCASARRLRAAAMHEHDANADLMQDADLLDAARASSRRESNASPPALSTKTLRLYIRMYGTAWRSAVTTIARSLPVSLRHER